MYGVIPALDRDHLFEEILNAIRQWPEVERRIFFQAHYAGHSPEDISRSLQLDVKKVKYILLKCDSRLHASLGSFCKGVRGKSSPAAA